VIMRDDLMQLAEAFRSGRPGVLIVPGLSREDVAEIKEGLVAIAQAVGCEDLAFFETRRIIFVEPIHAKRRD
jgi:hypothetical protein